MNKIISFLAVVVFCISCTTTTQKSNETDKRADDHMAFKDIPIDGSLNDFVSKMKARGFSIFESEKDGVIFKGDFAGYKNCYVAVATSKDTDLVNTVGVMFPERTEWSSLENDYLHLKKMLTDKYGEPTECVEQFQGYSTPDDNMSKMYSLLLDRCVYETFFETPKGDVILSLGHMGTAGIVNLIYRDKINTDEANSKALDDL